MNPSSSVKKELSKLLTDDIKKKKFNFKSNVNSNNALNYLSNDYEININDYYEKQLNEKQQSSKNKYPNKNIQYVYNLNSLSNDIKKLNTLNIKKINLCIFCVTTSSLKPFIEYILFNNKINDKHLLSFPFFYLDLKKKDPVIDLINEKINLIFGKDLDFKGYFIYDDEIYTFFSLPDNFKSIQNLKKNDPYWFSTIDEIINLKKVLNFDVLPSVSEVFLNNQWLIFLLNSKNEKFEIPSVYFSGQNASKTNFIARFGIMKASPFAPMGPYYYFSTFERALRYASWSHNFKEEKLDDILITDNDFGRYKEGGLVRIAVFMGKTNVLLNKKMDKGDDWTKNYNSIYEGQISDKNNNYNQIGAQVIVKKYYQQFSLSFHFIDKKTVPENYSLDNKIKII